MMATATGYKATFQYKYLTGYNNEYLVLVYEYRGYEYDVYENLAKGYSVSLRTQHIQNQQRIDSIIEERSRIQEPVRREDTADYAIEEFLKFLDES